MTDRTQTELVEATGALTAAVATLTVRYQRSRRQLIILAVSVVLDLALSLGFFITLHRTNDALAQAEQAQRETAGVLETVTSLNARGTARRLATCEAGNVSSKRQHELWERTILRSQATGDTPTPEQAKARDAFLADLDTIYPQVNCFQFEADATQAAEQAAAQARADARKKQ